MNGLAASFAAAKYRQKKYIYGIKWDVPREKNSSTMINRSPWLWGTRKTAAGLTGRTSNGIQILQGKRAPGQSNPSAAYLLSQLIAGVIWPVFRAAQGFIRSYWTNAPEGTYPANAFFKYTYENAIDLTDPEVPVIDPEFLKFTSGVMTSTLVTAVVADESANTITVTFPTSVSDASQNANDNPLLVIRNRTDNIWKSISVGSRSAGTTGAITGAGMSLTAGDVIDVYLSFIGSSGETNEGTVSDSVYATTVVVA